jgi:hypothetical protein
MALVPQHNRSYQQFSRVLLNQLLSVNDAHCVFVSFFFCFALSILKREFNSLSVPMFAVGGYGLPPYFAMELSASSS